MVLQEAMIAGHAASASSARHPGSFDQLTGSKRTVGAGDTASLRVGTHAARAATAAQTASRLMNVITGEVRPLLLANGECPH
jgi:hypothetical protein